MTFHQEIPEEQLIAHQITREKKLKCLDIAPFIIPLLTRYMIRFSFLFWKKKKRKGKERKGKKIRQPPFPPENLVTKQVRELERRTTPPKLRH